MGKGATPPVRRVLSVPLISELQTSGQIIEFRCGPAGPIRAIPVRFNLAAQERRLAWHLWLDSLLCAIPHIACDFCLPASDTLGSFLASFARARDLPIVIVSRTRTRRRRTHEL